uniref:Transcription factor EGL1 n=1 Tax=Cajanus cajan TaxID=3821 RepID=A0A151UCM1_CAJCA|nr:Transcription factor EGL1 [Cajanus cajan]
MASDPKHEKMNNLCTQLAVAVRSIQWSYGIFWAPSTTQERVLEWRDGYYNGDIKTRKTVQSMELEMKADKIGVQRSEQLKELYKFLLAGESDPQAKRPSAALAPEDLSDLEWYYLVCMSFLFTHNQSLPGRAVEIGETVWLCNAQHAESKVFSRSLLAKKETILQKGGKESKSSMDSLDVSIVLDGYENARRKLLEKSLYGLKQSLHLQYKKFNDFLLSLGFLKSNYNNCVYCVKPVFQTVVCFPYRGGVIELGTTELVTEDPNLIQHVKACFLEISKPTCSDKSSSVLDKPNDDKYPICTKGDHRMLDTMPLENPCSLEEKIKFDHDPINELQDEHNEDSNMDSPDGCEHPYPMDESLVEGINGVPSQVHFVNDALVIGAPDSLSSCDCMSEASENQGKASKSVGQTQVVQLQEDCYHPKRRSLDAGVGEDLCYIKTLCAILGNSATFKPNSYAGNSNYKSSFAKWKKGRVTERKRPKLHQSMLKKTLFKVPFMHRSCSSLKSQKEKDRLEWTSKLENGDGFLGNVVTDKKRENKNFLDVKSLAPSSISEMEKISILGDTIKYLKKLETRVEELESYMEVADPEARTKRKCPDVLEQMSDNYGARKICMGMKPWINKRKGCGIDEIDTELERIVSEDAKALDVKVNVKEQEVLIEMKCPYREYILYDIMDTINNLHLDAHTVESSTSDGVLSLTLKSKVCHAIFFFQRNVYEL